MGGRVKYKTASNLSKVIRPKKLGAREAPPAPKTSAGSVFQFTNDNGPMLDKSSIVWISILSVLAAACFIFAIWLLFRCKCGRGRKSKRQANRHRYHPSLDMKDGRNEFEAWNKSEARVDSVSSVRPLSSAAVPPAGFVHPGNPVIVDEVHLQPIPTYGRNKERYYSGLSSSLKRFSSIGKAY